MCAGEVPGLRGSGGRAIAELQYVRDGLGVTSQCRALVRNALEQPAALELQFNQALLHGLMRS